MLTQMQAEGLLNALRDVHECGADCTLRCALVDLEPCLPADRAVIEGLSLVSAA